MADAGLVERNRCDSRKKKKKGKGCKARKAKVEYGEARKDDKFEPVPKAPLHETENGFVTACAEFTDLYPKDSEVPSVSFRAAEIYIKKGHYLEGVKRLEVLMDHHSKHKWAGYAAATLFDANYRLRKWDQMERWGRYMLKRKNFKVLKKKQLKNVIAVSIHEYALELRTEKKPLKAAEQWMRFVNEFPKHDKAAIALFNSAAIMETAEKTEDAIELYERLIKNYKKAPQSTEAHFVLGLLYESQTDFEKAAGYFEKMATFPDVPQMADALYNAGSIRGALEQHQKAIDIFETYVSKFPADDNTPKLYLTIAEFYVKLGKYKDAEQTYNKYIKKYKKTKGDTIVEMHLRKAKLFQDEGKKHARRDALRQLNMALKVFKKLPDATKEDKKVRAAAAEARFLLAEYVYQDFEKVKVSFPERVLKKTLVKKAELLEKSGKIYFDVLEFKSHAVTAGALYRIGESYYLFAQSLFDLPIPEELNEDEQIIYRAELDDRAAPLQEKAIEALKRALQLAHENHVYNEWSRRSATLLEKLSPELFPVVEDHAVNTEHPVPATFSTTYIKDPAGKLEQMISPSKAAAEAAKKDEKKPADGAKTAPDGKKGDGAEKKAPSKEKKPTAAKKKGAK
jgi:TolA-binding protein